VEPDKHQTGDVFDSVMILSFTDFSLHVNVSLEVEYYDAKRKAMGCRITELSKNKISILSYIIKAFMTGQLIASTDILQIVSRSEYSEAHIHPKRSNDNLASEKPNSLPVFVPMVAGGLLALCALLLIGWNIYQYGFTVTADQGAIRAQQYVVRAPVSGTFHSSLEEEQVAVSAGELLGKIKSFANEDGFPVAGGKAREVALYSPCDCIVYGIQVKDGEFRALGESIYLLQTNENKAWAEFVVPSAQARKIKTGNRADIFLAGRDKSYKGHVSNVNILSKDMQYSLVRFLQITFPAKPPISL